MSTQPQQEPNSQPVGPPLVRPPLQQQPSQQGIPQQPQGIQPPRPQQISQAPGGPPPPRPFIPGGPIGAQPRGPLPPRPSGPNSFAPQQPPPQQQQFAPRPPIQGQPYQTQGPPPGVRQPILRPQGAPQPQGPPPLQQQQYQYQPPPQLEKQGSFNQQQQQQQQQRPPAPPLGQVPRQGSFATSGQQPPLPRPASMEADGSPAAKNRSFSIAAPGVLSSANAHEEDRRRSLATVGAKVDDQITRSPGLTQIREGIQSFDKKESPLNVGLTRLNDDKGSRESSRSETPDRPSSRMTDSIIGSLDGRSNGSPKIHRNDDDDVIIHNNGQIKPIPQVRQTNGYKPVETPSPILIRNDSAGVPQQRPMSSTPEPAQRPPSSVSIKKEPVPEMKRSDTPESAPKPNVKPTDLGGPIKPQADKTRKAMSAPKFRREGDNDSGVDESTQGNDMNGSPLSPGKKSPSKIPKNRSGSKSAVPHTPNTPDSATKLPMNKIQVGAAPSPNIKAVKSKIGSLENATHKPGGGHIKIENRKLDIKATPRINAKNDAYIPGGGDKKIPQAKLQWNAKSKIGSLENASHKPGGGEKKIESVKLDFKEKAKPKVASTVNIHHKPGGGDVKIEDKKLEIKAQSKIGSLDNVKHKPGGGDIKIFDDKQYLKQVSGGDHTPCESPVPQSKSDHGDD